VVDTIRRYLYRGEEVTAVRADRARSVGSPGKTGRDFEYVYYVSPTSLRMTTLRFPSPISNVFSRRARTRISIPKI
jgi:hypothetical protein